MRFSIKQEYIEHRAEESHDEPHMVKLSLKFMLNLGVYEISLAFY